MVTPGPVISPIPAERDAAEPVTAIYDADQPRDLRASVGRAL